jgi:hypothetical protein
MDLQEQHFLGCYIKNYQNTATQLPANAVKLAIGVCHYRPYRDFWCIARLFKHKYKLPNKSNFAIKLFDSFV